MSDASEPTEQEASNILILGILGIVLCQVFAVLAWVRANDYLARCEAAGVAPDRNALTGRMLGIASVVLTVVVLILLAVGGAFAIRYLDL